MVETLMDEIFEDIVETIRAPLLVLDSDLKVILVNQSFYDSFKVKLEETMGQLIYDLGNKQWDIPKLRELLETILPEKTSFDNYEVEHDFATIGRRIMLLNARQIERAMGKERIILVVIEDITERREIESNLKSTNELLEIIFSSTHFLIAYLDKDFNFIRVNSAYARDGGKPPDYFIGKNHFDLYPHAENQAIFEKVVQTGEPCTYFAKQFDHPDQPKRGTTYRDWSLIPVKDREGGVLGLVFSLDDVTAAKETDRKLKELNEELEERIKERTSSLEDLNIALRVLLKKREEDKNQIGANIYANFKSLIQPLLNQLKNSLTMNTQEDILDILESSIKEMATPFSKKLADPIVGLTPSEIQVAALVKDGKTNKEIAQILNKSIRAITSHRDNIRLKLGLKNNKTNLRSYLLSLE